MVFDNFRYNEFGLPPHATLCIWAYRKKDIYGDSAGICQYHKPDKGKPVKEKADKMVGYFCYPPMNGFGNGRMKLKSKDFERMIKLAASKDYEISLITGRGRGGSSMYLTDKSVEIIEGYTGEKAQPIPEQPGELF